jgi:drug/metabolite transporter (DMT)-like permease
MRFSLIWPIALIVLSNVVYNICSKEIPPGIHPFAALSVTYIIGAIFSTALYFLLNRGGNLLQEYQNLNWSSFLLGLAVVGLEAGSIYMYKAGWNVSSGQLVYSILLAVCLILVGVFAYHESISITKIIGIAVCMAGLFLIGK